MPLPGNVSTGTVIAKFIDSAGAAASGTVTFTPSPAAIKNVTAAPPTFILPKPVTATLDVNGSISVELVATDDPDNSPVDWTYLASFAFGGNLRLDAFSFELPSATTVDLAVVAPTATAEGEIIVARGVPTGGTTGQVLVKASTTNYDAEWADPGGGGAWGEITGTLTAQTDLQAALNAKRNLRSSRNAQTGTAYTLVLADEDKYIDISNVGTHTLTVPTNASVAFPVGARIGIYRRGSGDVVVAPASGSVIIEAPNGQLSLPNRYDTAWLTQRVANTWALEVNPDLSLMATDAELAGAITGLAAVASSGDYADLSGTPTLPVSKDAMKTALTEYTTSTVTADPDLILALPVGTFDVDMLLLYDGTANNDMKVQPTFSGTATIGASVLSPRAAAAANTGTNVAWDSGLHNLGAIVGWGGTFSSAGASGQGVALPWRMQGRVVVTGAGNLGVSVAKQNNTDTGGGANATRLLAGSYLSAVQIVTTP